MRDHLKILGILNMVLGCLTALAGTGDSSGGGHPGGRHRRRYYPR